MVVPGEVRVGHRCKQHPPSPPPSALVSPRQCLRFLLKPLFWIIIFKNLKGRVRFSNHFKEFYRNYRKLGSGDGMSSFELRNPTPDFDFYLNSG